VGAQASKNEEIQGQSEASRGAPRKSGEAEPASDAGRNTDLPTDHMKPRITSFILSKESKKRIRLLDRLPRSKRGKRCRAQY
jgi:hypothetical protein